MALAELENLETLDLSENYIVDLSALTAMCQLKKVHLEGNFLDVEACCEQLVKIKENNPNAIITHDLHPNMIVCSDAMQ